jgi:putative PIN family toxin of toxin-antitoxin system
MRIVLDSNIYISAALSVGGQPSAILKLAEESALDIFITDSIIDEIERMLKEKLGWSQSKTSLWTRYIRSLTDRVQPHQNVQDCRDPDDNHILECALEADAEIIMTGDHDLLELHPYRGINILTPRQFIESL